MIHIASFRFVSARIIYFFSIHFILNELSSSHFLDFRDFRKKLVLEVIDNLSPRKSEKFPLVSEFDETFLGR